MPCIQHGIWPEKNTVGPHYFKHFRNQHDFCFIDIKPLPEMIFKKRVLKPVQDYISQTVGYLICKGRCLAVEVTLQQHTGRPETWYYEKTLLLRNAQLKTLIDTE